MIRGRPFSRIVLWLALAAGSFFAASTVVATVSTTNSYVRYSGNGSTTEFEFNFPVWSSSELAVTLFDTDGDPDTQVLNTDYTVSIDDDTQLATVTMTTAPPSGYTLDIRSNVANTQDTRIRNQGRFLPEVHEQRFDKLTRQIQDLKRQVDQSLRYPDNVDADGEMSPLSNWENRYVYVNEDGEFEPAETVSTTTLSQSVIGGLLFPQTSVESDAGITPTDVAVPPGSQIDLQRYGLCEACSGATNRQAFEHGIDVAAETGGAILLIPPGTYTLDATVTIDADRVFIEGAGQNATTISFDPASPDVVFHFTKGASSIVQAGIKGLAFTSANSTTKTAIKLDDCRDCIVEEIGISSGSWPGSSSIGLHTNGRDTLRATKLHMLTARPIVMSANPNHATLDADHFHFSDLEVGTTEAAGKVIEIEDGVYWSNMTFDGYQAWLLGEHGLYYNDTSAATIDVYNLRISGMRSEQAATATGYSVYLASTNNDIKAVKIDNSNFDNSRNGVFGRLLETISVEDSFFGGTTGRTNFNITFTARTQLRLSNTFVNTGATVTLANSVVLLEAPWASSAQAMTATGMWRYDEGALVSRKARREDGVLSFKYKGTVADDGQLNLPVLSSTGADVAVFRVAMKTGATLAYAHGAWMPGANPDIYGTSSLVSNTSVDGDLCVIDNTSALSVINRLGGTADVVIDVTWSD